MKKLIPALAGVFLVVAGYLFGGTDLIDFSGTKSGEIQKITEIPWQLAEIKKEGLAPRKYADVFVTKITDGDTLEVTYKGESQKVRLLCVDTPESVKQGVAMQEYSREASKFTADLVLNQSVRLIFEKGLRDRYGRLLAHVILKDGSYLNAMLVINGYARVEIVSPNSLLSDYFHGLQNKAVSAKTGLWGLPRDRQPFVKNEKGDYIPRYKVKKEAS